MIFIVLGKSGAGKSTLVDFVKVAYNISVIKQYTTRKRRNELDDEYVFLEKDEFLHKDIIHKKKYNGHFYGVGVETLINVKDAILITDLLTARLIRRNFDARIIYIRASFKQRLLRLKSEKRNLVRLAIDFIYFFDYLYADTIISNHCGKNDFIREVRGYFDENFKSA